MREKQAKCLRNSKGAGQADSPASHHENRASALRVIVDDGQAGYSDSPAFSTCT